MRHQPWWSGAYQPMGSWGGRNLGWKNLHQPRKQYTKSRLTRIAVEDIAGIEIMNTLKNTHAYEMFYEMQRSIYSSRTFIEITTHAGKGKFNKSVPGTYLYKPQAPVIAKTFYSPHYIVKNITPIILCIFFTLQRYKI